MKKKLIIFTTKAKRLSDSFFAMAKIRRIGHDHQAPFWHVLVRVDLVVVLVGNQVVT